MLYQSLESVTDTGYLTNILQLYTLCRSVMIFNYKLGKPEIKLIYSLGQNSNVKADGCERGVPTTKFGDTAKKIQCQGLGWTGLNFLSIIPKIGLLYAC